MCSTWSEETWTLADKRRTCAARKSVMTRKKRQNKKKRKTGHHSDLSDDISNDGSTTPQGYAARGKTHHGGSLLDAECSKSLSLFVCIEVLRPSQPNGVMSSMSVYLTTRLLGRLSPLSG